MRRLVLAAAAALAACSVALEGAPCTTDANCPDSQRCEGTGAQPGRCVACQADPACTADGFTCVGSNTLRECRTNAGTCRYSRSIDCGTIGCTGSSPNASCPCPVNVGDLFADAVQGTAGAPFNPTGLASPAQCRYRRLGDALAAASAGRTVRMAGWTGGEVRFSGAATGESFPLVVKPGVTLTTQDSPLVPAHYVVEVDQPGATRPVLQLDHDSAASGFTVRPGAGGTASDAVLVSCTGTGTVAVSSLVLDGKGALAAGALGEGLGIGTSCGVNVRNVLVENAIGAGIRVGTVGVALGSPSVSIDACTLRGNGDGGLVVDVDASTAAPSLSVTGNDIAGNGATTDHGLSGTTRRAGGVVLISRPPSPLVFTGNLVHGNRFDQVLVFSSLPWSLSATACATNVSNIFTCYDSVSPGGPWVGLSAIGGGAVNAGNDYWASAVPSSGMDYFQAVGSSISFIPSCGASPLTCP